MQYTLESATQRLLELRRQLAHLQQREASQRKRLEQLENDYRAAQRAHSEALMAKADTLGKFGAGWASQAEVDGARRLVDEEATRLGEKEELVRAVEADLQSITLRCTKSRTISASYEPGPARIV